MSVRLATPADLRQLLDMARAMHAESVYRHLAYDEGKMAANFVKWMEDFDVCVFLYGKGQRSALAFFVGCAGPHFFGSDCGAWDKLFYARPEARGGLAAFRLFQAFVGWAKGQGALDVWPGVTSGSPAAENFYRRLGCERVGALFRVPL